MNALADRPAAARHFPTLERPRQNARSSYMLGMFAALGIHAAVIFGWPQPPLVVEPLDFAVEAADSSVEVSLVAALPAAEPVAEVPPEPPPVEPAPPEPIPEPKPEPLPVPEKPPEMTLPEPEPAPKPTPPPRAQPKPRKAPPKPAPAVRASGDGSSAIPGNDATTARASAGALGARPGYLRNPHPSYPDDARAAGYQGTVMLYVKVSAEGRVISVSVSRSSGHASLDERARSTVAGRWAFKPAQAGGVPIASDVIIPIRFTLNR